MNAPRRLPRLLGALAFGAALLAPRAARAFEHQWRAGANFGWSALLGATTSHGFGGGLNLTYGINDTFNLLAEINATAHPYAQWSIVSGAVGGAYVVDVGQWVPWVGAAVGPAGFLNTDPQCGLAVAQPCTAMRLNLEIPFGLDYQISRRFSVGVTGRFQLLLLGYSGWAPWETLGAFAHAEYTWGK
jgi:hypothetical protein